MIAIQQTLNNFSVLDTLKGHIFGLKAPYSLTLDRGILHPDIKTCPLCKSSTCRDGYNITNNRHSKISGAKIKKGKIRCTNPDCNFTYCVDKSVTEQLLGPSTDLCEQIILSLSMRKCSIETITGVLRDIFIPYSDEHIRKKVINFLSRYEAPSPKETPSGVIVLDEQFVKIKGLDYMRISILDANNSNVYYDKLEVDRQASTIRDIFKEVRKHMDNAFAFVIDGSGSSRKAIKETFPDAVIQNCLFHFAMNLRKAYSDDIGYGKGRRSFPLEHLIGFFCIQNCLFDHEREIIELRKIQLSLIQHLVRIHRNHHFSPKQKEQYAEDTKKKYVSKAAKYLKRVKKARRRKHGIKLELRTEEQARYLLEKAKLENTFPKSVEKQIQRLEDNWEDFTHCMRNSRIPPTSNKVEQYYAATLNWVEKNNLQSKEQFYGLKKVRLMRRYGISFIKEGVFSKFIHAIISLRTAFDPG